MITLFSTMEVLIVGPVPHVYPFQYIFSCMRMHKINYDLYAHAVCFIYQLLELTRRSESRGDTEKVSAVVAERSIIGMLYDSHDLDDIVSKIFYPWQYIFSEIAKSMHFLLNTGHSNMAFVHFNIHILPLWFFVLPLINAQINVDSFESVILILTCVIDPGWDAINHASILYLHLNLQGGEVRNRCIDFAGPQSELVLDDQSLTLSQTYSPLFQPLNSPKMEIYCA